MYWDNCINLVVSGCILIIGFDRNNCCIGYIGDFVLLVVRVMECIVGLYIGDKISSVF